MEFWAHSGAPLQHIANKTLFEASQHQHTTHMSTHITRSSRFLAPAVLLASTVGAVAAPNNLASSAAPGAGGYSSDFGSDYGVGQRRRAVGRQPIEVVGLRARTRGGTLQPWIGLRFGESLSNRLTPFMGRAVSSGATARRLALSGVRAPDVGCPWPQGNAKSGAYFSLATTKASEMSSQRALAVLQASKSREGEVQLIGTGVLESRSSLLLFGDVVLDGPLGRADSAVSVTIRVVRSDLAQPDRAEIVSPVVRLQAPARDWAQLPSRTALAVLDALQIPLKDAERVQLLRDASPLMPQASPARLALEQRLGTAMSNALDARLMQAKARRTMNIAARRQLLAKVVAQQTLALRELRVIAKSPVLAFKSERAAWSEITASARVWMLSTQSDLMAAKRGL